MNPYKLFSGKAFTIPMDKELKDGPNYDLILKILSHFDEAIEAEKITYIGSNESFDEYLISTKDKLYNLKLSLDESSPVLSREIRFLKENESIVISKFYTSGKIKVGVPVLYLLASHEDGLSVDDFGLSYIDDNLYPFLCCSSGFNKLKTETTAEEYLEFLFKNFSIKNSSDFLIENISNNYDIADIKKAFDSIESEIRESCNLDILSGDSTCHGFFSKRNIISRNSFFKFKNPSFSFRGNKLYDFSFLLVSLGVYGRDYAYALKKYCDLFHIDYKENKINFDHCTKIASGVFFYKLFFDFLIEESLFLNSRPEKTLSLISDYSNSSNHLKRLSCYDEVSAIIEKTITRQVSE